MTQLSVLEVRKVQPAVGNWRKLWPTWGMDFRGPTRPFEVAPYNVKHDNREYDFAVRKMTNVYIVLWYIALLIIHTVTDILFYNQHPPKEAKRQRVGWNKNQVENKCKIITIFESSLDAIATICHQVTDWPSDVARYKQCQTWQLVVYITRTKIATFN